MSTPAFPNRHIGPQENEIQAMLKYLGFSAIEDLTRNTIPAKIRATAPLAIPHFEEEADAVQALKNIFSENQVMKSFIGMGYYDTVTPTVILRNILENPGWYTQYTPYQAEIAQGRLEALLNFQTMVSDLTGLPVANASLLDEGTAAAEAMHLSYAIKGDDKKNVFFISEDCHPQVIEVIQTRANPLNIRVVVGAHDKFKFDDSVFGALFQYPTTTGRVIDYTKTIADVHAAGALAIVAADLLALTLVKTPGEMKADIAVGSAQRFGVPMGYGGPHAAYFATLEVYKRQIPGRIVGVSRDRHGNHAYRLALQTREQHIRREKATSNICTAQVLLAVMASMYAVYHGPAGLTEIAKRTHIRARALHAGLKSLRLMAHDQPFFDTVEVHLSEMEQLEAIRSEAVRAGINLRYRDSRTVTLSCDETTKESDIANVLNMFARVTGRSEFTGSVKPEAVTQIPGDLLRVSKFLTHPVFSSFHSETEMLRYMNRLQSKDLSLTTSMIPLGSCTMKLNATSEMIPVTWPEVGGMHPFAPRDQAKGYARLFSDLETWLKEITGFDGVSLQPNAGSQGEYAGLLAIRGYHLSRGHANRNVCLIPTSAHGTNPASAVMAGMKVVAVACDDQGNIDFADLKLKAAAHATNLSCMMVTYPSTYGVFEESIRDICDAIHAQGGQVYLDGANMNAQVGLCRPGDYGADVCHLNLHKTFCIPHGGGGPGMGPIGVKKHLVEFLPGHKVVALKGAGGAVSSAPWGSASILPISWMYIAMMGADGLKRASEVAILNANYVAKKLNPYFPALYKGREGLVAHECIIDFHTVQEETGVTVEDVAKRLMDYGYHAPTMSWPVTGTMMIEPTESESMAELDRFCDALISIHAEIMNVKAGKFPKENNMLKNAPHTASVVISSEWDYPYSREVAAFPVPRVREHKFWPAVSRVDNAAGDRNLVCSCPPWGEDA